MRFEGETVRIPSHYAVVDGASLCLAPGTRLTHGLHAIRLPPDVAVTDLRIDPELLAQGLDLANAGRQYGEVIYLRNLTGLILSVGVIGTAVVTPVAEPPAEAEDAGAAETPKASRRGTKAA